MANLSDTVEAAIINHILRTATWAKPAGVWFAMMSVAASDSGGGTEIVSGGATRIQVTQADANWTAPGAGGATENVNPITFPTNSGALYTVAAITVWDASSAGTLLLHGTLTASKAIDTGEQFRFNAGDVDFVVA